MLQPQRKWRKIIFRKCELKKIWNISNALYCKKDKTCKNKHLKYDKKGLGNIKPTKDYMYQDYIFLIFILSNYWQETKEEKTCFKKSQPSLIVG